MHSDLCSTRANVRSGECRATDLLQAAIETARSAVCDHVFAQTLFDSAMHDAARAAPQLPLAGLPVTVKDLFDLQGTRSAASSLVLADAPVATHDSPAVARLRAAGAAIIGRTHMVEFAYSGVGVNPHFGTPAAYDARFGALPGPARVSGGSSSGAAVSVASGAAYVGLGSDTGGSIRIPAALCGLVGFKNTARLTPLQGTVPLSPTLDTACAITRSVRDAILVHEILAARTVTRSSAGIAEWRLAVPRQLFFDDIEPAVLQAFERSLAQLRAAGAQIVDIDLPELDTLAHINDHGSFSGAESYAWHRPLLARADALGRPYDPRVRSRIERGASMTAAQYIDLHHARNQWIARMEQALAGYDALLSPTVPILAPSIDSVAPADGLDAAVDARRDAGFQRANTLLLRNPSVVNMLDGCALSLPCHQQGELPVGMMVWHGGMHDDAVLAVSQQIEGILQAA
ncbi:amidase [Comamonas antarctica]|uniref:Amidase n=1 Tax=Comamonas antarctica TaxID=2743470 RepID=A0A6N1X7K9_9BURK|nr:amidase [Comamonas antarctica]QKV53760.1 amidase [Comamonas antarctica]